MSRACRNVSRLYPTEDIWYIFSNSHLTGMAFVPMFSLIGSVGVNVCLQLDTRGLGGY